MKGGMTVLWKVGECINSVWENDRLWKILKVNKICFYLMWWGDMRCGQKKKDCFECWAREVVTQWNSRGSREEWNCFLKERSCRQNMRRAWTGAEDSVLEKKKAVRENRGGINVSHRLSLWRRGERRKGCRWHWLGLKEVLSLFSVTNSCGISAWHLEMCCLAVICNCHLQVYLWVPPGRFCQEWWMLSSWGGLSSLPCHWRLCFLLSTHCHAHRCHQETNTGFCSTDPFQMRDMDPRREGFNKCTRKLQRLKFTLCFSCYHTWCII